MYLEKGSLFFRCIESPNNEDESFFGRGLVLYGVTCFLSYSKLGESKLTVGVRVNMNARLSLPVGPATDVDPSGLSFTFSAAYI